MKKSLFIFLYSFIWILFANSSTPAKVSQNDIAGRFSITTSYFGEWIIHPGLTVGLEYLIFQNENKWLSIISQGNTGFYLHVQNHAAFFFDTEIGSRFTAPFGLFGDILFGVGYIHTWPYGKIYTGVDKDGNLIEKPNYGDPHLLLKLSTSPLGWDFEKNGLLPMKIYCRGVLFSEYPTNSFIISHVALEVGISYSFKTIKK